MNTNPRPLRLTLLDVATLAVYAAAFVLWAWPLTALCRILTWERR